MNTRQTIVEELEAISPLLAGMEGQSPFAAPPAGYFDGLAALILARIKTGELKGLSETLSIETGAFEEAKGLSEVLGIETSVAEELKGLSEVLAKMDKKLPFSVPEGYFAGLSSGILEKLKSGSVDAEKEVNVFLREGIQEKNPGSIQKKNPYAVPENYFQEFSGKLMDKIKGSAGEAAATAIEQGPHLATEQSLRSTTEQSLRGTTQQAHPEDVRRPQAKVVPLRARQKWIRYAAAALVAGIIAGAGWIFLGNQDSNNPGGQDQPVVAALKNDPRALSNVSPEDIGNLSAAEIGDYLETESLFLPDEAMLAFADISISDLQGMLADIPDETLQRYLIQTGNVEESFNN